MKLKSALTAGLLLFVAVALVAAVSKSFNAAAPMPAAGTAPAEAAASSAAAIPADGLTAVFFHGMVRCPTCKKIESYAHAALGEALQSGDIQWLTANYEAPENREIVEECQVVSSTVVLVRTEGAKRTAWKNLEKVWDYVDDEQEFKQYVQTEMQTMLSSK